MALCVVIEDQPLQRRTLEDTLRTAGYQVVGCGTGGEGLRAVGRHLPEVALLDLGLPDVDGLELIPRLLDSHPLCRILVLTGRDSVPQAVATLRAGARHYLVKPWDREELLVLLGREVEALNRETVERRDREADLFWGSCREMRQVRTRLERLAESPSTPVLIRGDTGTGKEVVARELHRITRAKGAFVAVNCAAVPADLMESELFGHERGAFTGAESRRRGMVELADHGTLFLDEVGETAAHLQAKLLRFLQDGTYRRVGSEEEASSHARVVAATNADLEAMQVEGRFRSDLYFRLSVVTLELPRLRDRREDLLPLTHFLLHRIARRLGRAPRPLSPRAEEAVMAHAWEGNVRELCNRLERALVLGTDAMLAPDDLDLASTGQPGAGHVEDVLRDPRRLRGLLEEEGWNLAAVARRLGTPRHRVRYRVERLGLTRPEKISPSSRR